MFDDHALIPPSATSAAYPLAALVAATALAGCFDVGAGPRPDPSDTRPSQPPSPDTAPADTPSSDGSASPDEGTPSEPTKLIRMKSQSFLPKTAEVTPGTNVTWKTLDRSEFHVVKDELPDSDESVDWESPSLRKDETWSRTFTEPGDHWYHCENHENTMIGKIVVTE